MRDEDLPPDAERAGLAMLAEAGGAIAAGVAREVPSYVTAQVDRILDAWGQAGAETRAAAMAAAAPAAGAAASERIGGALGRLLATDPSEQRSTPLEIVRTVYREPTEILDGRGGPGRRAGSL